MKTLISQFYGDEQSQHTMLQSETSHYNEMYLFNTDTVVVPGSMEEPIVFRLCYPEIGEHLGCFCTKQYLFTGRL